MNPATKRWKFEIEIKISSLSGQTLYFFEHLNLKVSLDIKILNFLNLLSIAKSCPFFT